MGWGQEAGNIATPGLDLPTTTWLLFLFKAARKAFAYFFGKSLFRRFFYYALLTFQQYSSQPFL